MIRKSNGTFEQGKQDLDVFFVFYKYICIHHISVHFNVNFTRIFSLFYLNRLAEEAALASFEQRDLHSLYTVHMNATKNNDRALVAKVENYIEKLSEKR